MPKKRVDYAYLRLVQQGDWLTYFMSIDRENWVKLTSQPRLPAKSKIGLAAWRMRGYAACDAARNQIASDALAHGFDELMWIDSDVVFDPDDVDKLRRHDLPLVCGIYPKIGCRQFACAFLPDTREVLFGVRGGLTEILYCGFGFVHTRRSLYETMQQQLS